MAEEENNGLVGSSFSLVRYNNPVLIDKKQDVLLSPVPPSQVPGQLKDATRRPGREYFIIVLGFCK